MERYADEKRYQYLSRLLAEERAPIRTSHAQGCVLFEEGVRQLTEDMQEIDRRREQENWRIAERDQISRERTRRDQGRLPRTGHWVPTPKGQRWVWTAPKRPAVEPEVLATSLQKKFYDADKKRREEETREWEEQERKQLK